MSDLSALLAGSQDTFLALSLPSVHGEWVEGIASNGLLIDQDGDQIVRMYLEAVHEATTLPSETPDGWLPSTAAAARFQHALADLREQYPIDQFHHLVSCLHGALRTFLRRRELRPEDRARLNDAADSVLDMLMAETTQEWAFAQAQTQKLKAELSGLYRIASSVSAAFDLDEVLKTIVQEIAQLLNCDLCALLLPSAEEEGSLEVRAAEANDGLMRVMDKMRFPLVEEGILSRVFQSGETSISTAPLADLNVTMRRRATLEGLGFRHLLAAPLRVQNRTVGVAVVANRAEAKRFDQEIAHLLSTVCSQAANSLWSAQLFTSNRAMSLDLVKTLAQALDARDSYTSNHSQNVATLARLLARQMDLSEEEAESIYTAGLLHDIGKIGIADAVLHKPGGLNQAERLLMMQHPVKSAQILEPVRGLKPIVAMVKHHHERYDGHGYPDRLSGETIPLGARILAVSDAFDVMSNHRIYRRARTRENILAELRSMAGKQFDPHVIDILMELISKNVEELSLKTSNVIPAAGTYYADGVVEEPETDARELNPVRRLVRAIERMGKVMLRAEEAQDTTETEKALSHLVGLKEEASSTDGDLALRRLVADGTDPRVLEGLADSLQTLLARKDSLETQLDQLRKLEEVSVALNACLSVEGVLQTAVEHAKRLLGVDVTALWLVQGDHHVTFSASAGKSRHAWPQHLRIGTEDLVGYVAYRKIPTAVVEYGTEDRFEVPEWILEEGFVSACALPVQLGTRLLGVMVGLTFVQHAFSAEEVSIFTGLANHTASALENAQLRAMHQQQALIDGVTGLSNHRHFQEKLTACFAAADRQGYPLSLLIFDVDHFEQYNRAHGHSAGDAVLKQVAETLRSRLGEGQVAARFGGEEFAVILPRVPLDVATALAEEIRQSIANTSFQAKTHVLAKLTVSLGVASNPAAESAMALLTKAKEALSVAKAEGRNCVRKVGL